MYLICAQFLLHFVEQELGVRDPVIITRECIRFARLVVEEGAREVSDSLQVDAVAARLLDGIPCTREQALRAADVRRGRYRGALEAGLPQGQEFDNAASFEGGAEFLAAIVLLAELPCFQGKVSDRRYSV